MYYINKIKELRNNRGLSQFQVAEILETTQQHYSCYENGKNELPIRHLITLCKYYKVSADYILGLDE